MAKSETVRHTAGPKHPLCKKQAHFNIKPWVLTNTKDGSFYSYTVYSIQPPVTPHFFLQGLYNNKYDTFKPPCIFTPTKDIHMFIILREPQQVPPGFLLSILKGEGVTFCRPLIAPPLVPLVPLLENGWREKQRQRSSRLFVGQNLFNSLPR